MLYCKQSVLRNLARKGGCFLSDFMLALPGILFWVVLFVVIKSSRTKREEESKHPQNTAQRELADDVIATIERVAPDLEIARVSYDSYYGKAGGIYFRSWSGYSYNYAYASHGYKNVSRDAAKFVADEIAKRFGRGGGKVGGWSEYDYFEVWIPRK